MRDKPHAAGYTCEITRTKHFRRMAVFLRMFTARKKINVEISAIKVGLQRGILSKTAHFYLNILIFNALNMLSALRLTYLT